jgi:hypothetical protein
MMALIYVYFERIDQVNRRELRYNYGYREYLLYTTRTGAYEISRRFKKCLGESLQSSAPNFGQRLLSQTTTSVI